MTVIVYRDGVMAADSAVWMGDVAVSIDAVKVRRHGDTLVGCAGDLADITLFHDWCASGQDKATHPKMEFPKEFQAIVADPRGVATVDGQWFVTPLERGEDWLVIGRGGEFVRGLLMAGKSAVECVQIAIERCAYAGGYVVALSLHEEAAAQPGDDGYVTAGLNGPPAPIDVGQEAGPEPMEAPRTWRSQYALE